MANTFSTARSQFFTTRRATASLPIPTDPVFRQIFGDLRSAAAGLGGLPTQVGNVLLGWLLAGFGYGEGGPNPALEDIKARLDALDRKVTELTGRVELAGFSALVHQTSRTLGEIDYAMDELDALARATDADAKKRAAFSENVVNYIGSHLLDAPAILNRHLGSQVPLADNLIKSRALSTRERFFDAHASDRVKSVYDYFAGYQAKLAILLTEYYHVKPDIYNTTYIKAKIDQIEANVTSQGSSLKSRVPANTVLDTRDGLMWTQVYEGSRGNPVFGQGTTKLGALIELFPRNNNPQLGYELRLRPRATSAGLPGLPFENWSVPARDDMDRLLSHRGDKSPYDWLANDAHISKSLLNATQSHFWVRDTFHITSHYHEQRLCYHLYALTSAGSAPITCKFITFEDERKDVLGIPQGTLYLRRPAPGEEYWWR